MRTIIMAVGLILVFLVGYPSSSSAQSTPPSRSICDIPQYRGTDIYNKYCTAYARPSNSGAATPSALELEEYSNLLNQLEETRHWTAHAQRVPQTTAELSRRIDELTSQLNQLLPEVWEYWSSANWDCDYYGRNIKKLHMENDAYSQSVESNQHWQASTAEESERFERQAHRLEQRVALAVDTASLLSERTNKTREGIIEWLYVVAPADSRFIERDSWERVHGVRVPPLPPQPSFERKYHPRAVVARTYTAVAVPHYPYPPISLAGSNQEKLLALSPSADRLQKWNHEGIVARNEAVRLKPIYGSLLERQSSLYRRIQNSLDLCDRNEDLRDFWRSRARVEAQRLRAANSAVVVRAVEDFVWKTYKERYVTPQVVEFYDENKRWYNLMAPSRLDDDTVAKLIARGKAALDLVGAHVAGLHRFNNVQREVLDLLGDEKHFIARAPQILALGTPQEIQSYLGSVDAMVQDHSYRLVRESGGGPFSISPDQLQNGWVPQQLLHIAKRLGVVKSSEQ